MNEDNNADVNQDQNVGTQEPAQEKLVQMTQHKLDEIVKNAKRDAEEKGRRSVAAQPSQMGGMQQESHDHIVELATQRALQKLREEQQADEVRRQHESEAKRGTQIAHDFLSKIEANKERVPGIDSAVKELNLGNAPHVVHLLNEVDNMPEVLKEMRENPSKLALIDSYYTRFGPDLARQELQKLSNSIKTNDAAASMKTAKEPLSQIQPSTVGTDNGSMSIKDLRKQPWLRG